MENLIEMNVNSTVWMTRIALPGMLSRKRGAIVNFASAAALNPTPLLAGYAGAKGLIVVSGIIIFTASFFCCFTWRGVVLVSCVGACFDGTGAREPPPPRIVCGVVGTGIFHGIFFACLSMVTVAV